MAHEAHLLLQVIKMMKGWKHGYKRIYSWISNGNNKVKKWKRSEEGVCTDCECVRLKVPGDHYLFLLFLSQRPPNTERSHMLKKKLQIHTFTTHTRTMASTPAAQLSTTLRSNCLHLLHMAYFFLRPTCFFSSLPLTLLSAASSALFVSLPPVLLHIAPVWAPTPVR